MNDLISRQEAIDAVVFECGEWIGLAKEISKRLRQLPSAQPPLDEWCDDCKEYDSEKHCCPRWNRVIRQTLAEAQPQRKTGKWIRHKDWASEGYCEYTCSECDMGVDVTYNFCPRCGARMDGGEQE